MKNIPPRPLNNTFNAVFTFVNVFFGHPLDIEDLLIWNIGNKIIYSSACHKVRVFYLSIFISLMYMMNLPGIFWPKKLLQLYLKGFSKKDDFFYLFIISIIKRKGYLQYRGSWSYINLINFCLIHIMQIISWKWMNLQFYLSYFLFTIFLGAELLYDSPLVSVRVKEWNSETVKQWNSVTDYVGNRAFGP